MEAETAWFSRFLISLSLLFTLILTFKLRTLVNHRKLPPSPPSLPVIGHLHLLKDPFHRVLHNLSLKYGPILYLSFGSRPVMVVSSPAAAQECFTKNDIVFANRPRLLSGKYINYNYTAIGFAPYGHHWRNMRRLATTELLSNHRLNTYLNIRVEELKLWVKNLYDGVRGESNDNFVHVEMKSRLNELSFNTVMRMISGKCYFGVEVEDAEEAREFREIMKELLQLSGASNPADFLPILRVFDFQGLEKRMLKASRRADEFVQNLIDKQREKRGSRWPEEKHENTTMIQSLLSLQESQSDYYTDDIIKGQVLTMLSAGTDTTTGTIEWALSLLLNHPTTMKKAWTEISECVGENRMVEEADISKLQYLQAIIYETLRLFPVAPLLVPHESSEDCRIEGFDVPKGTMLLVNAWAIHRDPKVWEDPTSFRPERFVNWESTVESYKWIPFGMGRRACPGAALGQRVVGLTLATLIQCFEWERLGEEKIDLSEGSGITMPKAKPLEAMSRARSSMVRLLSQL